MTELISRDEKTQQKAKSLRKGLMYCERLDSFEDREIIQTKQQLQELIPEQLDPRDENYPDKYSQGFVATCDQSFVRTEPNHIEVDVLSKYQEQGEREKSEEAQEFMPPPAPSQPVLINPIIPHQKEQLSLDTSLNYIFLRNERPENSHRFAKKFVSIMEAKELGSLQGLEDKIILDPKRSNEFTNKVSIVIKNKVTPNKDFRKCATDFDISMKEAKMIFGGEISIKKAQLMIDNNLIFDMLFNQKFLEEVLNNMYDESKNDIKTNIVSKVQGVNQAEEDRFLSSITNDEGTKFKRSFKKPFLMQENISAIINYLKSFIYWIKKDYKLTDLSDSEASLNIQGNMKLKFDKLVELKRLFKEKLIDLGLIMEVKAYPYGKKRKTTGKKDLDVQTYLKKRSPVAPNEEDFP